MAEHKTIDIATWSPREIELDQALRRLLHWFGRYPEFVPNPDRIEQCVADLDAAKELCK